MLLSAALLITASACDSGGQASSPDSLAVSGTASPADAAATPNTQASTPADSPATTGPDVPSTTVVGQTSAPPTSIVDRPPLRAETPLPAGKYSTTQLAGPVLSIDVDLPVDGLFALDEEGALLIAEGSTGERTLLTMFHLDNGDVLAPTIDAAMLADREYADSVSEPSPPDILEWFTTRPGVELGPIEDSEIGGVVSRRRTVTFDAFDGGVACLPADDRICHWLVRAPVTGLAVLQNAGDGLVAHEVVVAGHRLLVLIDTMFSPEVASAIADSVRFHVVPHPATPDDSEPLPFAGPLRAGTTYVHERSKGGVWLVEGVDGVDMVTGFLRDRFVRISADGAECMSLTDATQGFWFGVALGPDGDIGIDGRKLDTDLASLIEGSAELEIVAGPVDVPLGELTGTAYDVRPTGGDDVVLAATSIMATAGEVTRVVAAPLGDSDGADLAIVTLGSPCEALLDGLTFLPGAER